MKLRKHATVALFAFFAIFSVQIDSGQSQTSNRFEGRLIFQTNRPWSPRTNINADTVMVYGIDDTIAQRIDSWRDHGYRVTVMTGVAWGSLCSLSARRLRRQAALERDAAGKAGKLRLHSGREVPYIAPSLSYGRYLAKGVEGALDAGAEAIYP